MFDVEVRAGSACDREAVIAMFDAAIAWACRPVRASIAPLTPSARRIGELDGYEVSDILVHHGIERYAGQQRVPITPWDILAEQSGLDASAMVGLRAGMAVAVFGFTAAGVWAMASPIRTAR